MSSQRADARRNYARLLAVAEQEIAEHGADASLEQIARIAGVGSATVRRHFPSRHALLDAVFRGVIENLGARARELADATDARAALLDWLTAVNGSVATIRGLATALTRDCTANPPRPTSTAPPRSSPRRANHSSAVPRRSARWHRCDHHRSARADHRVRVGHRAPVGSRRRSDPTTRPGDGGNQPRPGGTLGRVGAGRD
ncbi:TetR/AcrR family transcriptional regulator [Micromonospora sp. M12]